MTATPQQTLWDECDKILNHETHRSTLSDTDKRIGLQAAALEYAARMYGYNTAHEMEVDLRPVRRVQAVEYQGTPHRKYEVTK